jgi:hypothetical protein
LACAPRLCGSAYSHVMSINVGYFFNSSASLPEVAELLNKVLGCRFEPYEGDNSDLFCRFLSLETSLCAHHLEDDGDLDFTAYRYQLDTRTPAGAADNREVQLGLMAMLPSILQLRAGITSGMLVYDTQRLLARYEMRGNKFFDTVSGRPVSYPDHFGSVFEGIPAA